MLAEFLKDYLPIILFLIIALGLSLAFVAINYIAAPSKPDPEKLSAYECGFEPFNDSRMEFDVRFYLVDVLVPRFWAVSSVGRASRLHRGGQRFESFTAHQIKGGVAQLVRARACHARGRGFESLHSRHFCCK